MANKVEKVEVVIDFSFLGSQIPADNDYTHGIKMLTPWKKSCDKPRQCIKKQRHYFANKDLDRPSYGVSSNHAWMWELDHKDGWVLKNGCFWTVVLEKTLEGPLDSKELKPVNPKGNQPWILIGRTVLKLKLQYFAYLMCRVNYWKRPWCWERLKEKGEGGSRAWEWFDSIIDLMNMDLSKPQEIMEEPGVLQSMG